MSYETLLYDVDDRVATITFNRADRLNAFSQQLVDEVMDAVPRADRDPDVRVIIVRGAGDRAFSAGYDIKESAEAPKKALADWRARMQKDLRFTYSVWDCSKPVIAMIHGHCLAGALEFAQCCDMRYCSDDARFGVVETRFSSGVATMIMPWILGNRCRELIYTGDTIDAKEALRLGLVDRIFPRDALDEETLKIAKRISRVSMECLVWGKRSINHSFDVMGIRSAMAYGADACAILDASGSPENSEFDRVRRSKGLGEALRWRDAQFKQFE